MQTLKVCYLITVHTHCDIQNGGVLYRLAVICVQTISSTASSVIRREGRREGEESLRGADGPDIAGLSVGSPFSSISALEFMDTFTSLLNTNWH